MLASETHEGEALAKLAILHLEQMHRAEQDCISLPGYLALVTRPVTLLLSRALGPVHETSVV